MKSESSLVIELWELVRDFIPISRRPDVALSVLRSFEEYGFESADLSDILDEDESLTAAYRECFDIEDEEIEDDE